MSLHICSAGGHARCHRLASHGWQVTAALDGTRWEITTAEERLRTVASPGNRSIPLHDVVVRATRRP